MTRTIALLATALLAACRPSQQGEETAPAPEPFDPATVKPEVKEFAGSLKQLLLDTLGKEGPVAAIAICSDEAPKKAAEFRQRTGWTIRRSALRLRNPDNAPDAWERKVLEEFQAKAAAGTPVAELAFGESLPAAGDQPRSYRFAKAIPTAAECLLCHGPTVAEPIREAITEHYPEDKASGFQLDELRGIISVTVPLEDR